MPEQTSLVVDAWISHADFVATSCTSLVEVAAVFSRRPPWTRPSRPALDRALQRLSGDWEDYIVVDIDERRAAGIAWRRHLEAQDAVHLAAALTLVELAAPLTVMFSSFDRELGRAALKENLCVIQPPS